VSATIGLFLAAFLLAGLRGGALADVEGAGIGAGERSSDAHLMALAAAFNLAGGLALGKLAGVMRSLEKLKLSHGALKKQADGLQLAYKALQDQSEGKPAASGSTPSQESFKDDEVSRLKAKLKDANEKFLALDKTNAKLAKENDTIAAEKKAAEATADALKRQATAVTREYERLQEENEGLKDQLADLDGDADRVERKKDS